MGRLRETRVSSVESEATSFESDHGGQVSLGKPCGIAIPITAI